VDVTYLDPAEYDRLVQERKEKLKTRTESGLPPRDR
jgi:hypothetical protein